VTALASASSRLRLNIEGMTCTACQASLARALSRNASIVQATVSYANAAAVVDYDAQALSLDALIALVERAGFSASLPRADSVYAEYAAKFAADDHKHARDQKRMAFSVVFALLATAASMLFMTVAHHGTSALLRGVFALVFSAAAILAGYEQLLSGFRALARRSPTMHSLIALGATLSFVFSVWMLLADGTVMRAHFETAAWIMAFALLGRSLESRASFKTRAALRALEDLRPSLAHLTTSEGEERDVPALAIERGDRIVVRPGERIPLDGIVARGTSDVDESSLTGELIPKAMQPGDVAKSGTMNLRGALWITVSKRAEDGTLAQIVELLRTAETEDAPLERLVNAVSYRFVPSVLSLAALTTSVWHFVLHAPFAHALEYGMSVLVIACPCALGLATPTALAAATGKAARTGFLFRSMKALEALSVVGKVAFDKTGTLTKGQPRVVTFEGDAEALCFAASIEQGSEHPLARAIAFECTRRGTPWPVAQRTERLPGLGVRGEVEGQTVEVRKLKDAAQTAAEVFVNGASRGIFHFEDDVRPEAAAAVARLKHLGCDVMVLSGDVQASALKLGAQLNIEALGDLSPEDKLSILRSQTVKTAMVGDGVNDAPALAHATVGIAMAGGQDLAAFAAGAVLLRDDLRLIPEMIVLARKTTSVVKQNLAWAFGYNFVCIPIAAGLFSRYGLALTPALASALMAFSSVTVVLSSLRLSRD
jgi:P-type Cu+ transporter